MGDRVRDAWGAASTRTKTTAPALLERWAGRLRVPLQGSPTRSLTPSGLGKLVMAGLNRIDLLKLIPDAHGHAS